MERFWSKLQGCKRIRLSLPRGTSQQQPQSPPLQAQQAQRPTQQAEQQSNSPASQAEEESQSPAPQAQLLPHGPAPEVEPPQQSPAPQGELPPQSPAPEVELPQQSPAPRAQQQSHGPTLQEQQQAQGLALQAQQRLQSPVPEAQDLPQILAPQVSASRASAEVPVHPNNFTELKSVLDYLDQAFDESGQQRNGQVAVPEAVRSNLKRATLALERVREHCMRNSDGQGLVGDIAGESGKIFRDILEGHGNVGWIMGGLLLIASVKDRLDQMSSNAEKCFIILAVLRKLGHHLVSLFQGIQEGDATVTLREAISLIVEGVILCLKYSESGSLERFAFVNVHESNLNTLRQRIHHLYPDLFLTVFDRQISKPLRPFTCSFPKNPVGLHNRIGEVLKLLRVMEGKAEPGVQAVLLLGMVGIGKTILGEAVCSQLSNLFIDRSFAQVEVGEKPNKKTICNCQTNILERLTGRKQTIGDSREGREELKNYFASLKTPILLFLDNIFHKEHLEDLIPAELALPTGSRIIVTSRDKNLSEALSETGVACAIYPVPVLDKPHARELLKHHLKEYPAEFEGEDDVNSILQLCHGLPLAIQAIGTRLKSKRDNESAWHSAVECFQRSLNTSGRMEEKLISSLRSSYDELSKSEQYTFLDLSCLLRDVEWSWLQTLYGLSVDDLEDLSLVEKDDSSNAGHSLQTESILSMERELLYSVRGFLSDSTRRWLCGSAIRIRVHNILATFGQNLSHSIGVTRFRAGKSDIVQSPSQAGDLDKCENVEGIVIKGSAEPLLAKKLDAICKSLRIIVLEGVKIEGNCFEIPSRLQICSTPYGFPFRDPSCLDELRVLEIGHHVRFSFKLVQFPKRLEILKLFDLAKLRHFHQDAFGRCSSLHTFEVLYCPALKELPLSFFQLKKLRVLILLGNAALRTIPEAFQLLDSLQVIIMWSLQLHSKGRFEHFVPNNLSRFTRLQNLALDCAQTQQLPGGLGNLRSLKRLNVLGCQITKKLPDDFSNLSSLYEMRLAGCQGLCELPNDLGKVTALCRLELEGCECLAGLPHDISKLTALKELTLTGCKSLQNLPEGFGKLFALSRLILDECFSLRELPSDFGELEELKTLNLTGCKLLTELPKEFGKLIALSELWLSGCESLRQLPGAFGELKSLKTLGLIGCKVLTVLPEGFGKLVALSELRLKGCDNLRRLSGDFGELKSLQTLELIGCQFLTEFPEGLGKLLALSKLKLDGCVSMCRLPCDFGDLMALKTLELIRCKLLKELPGGFGKLVALSELWLEECDNLCQL